MGWEAGAIFFLLGAAAAPEHANHDLGTVRFPVSCSAPAQAGFTRAVALLHHMTYPQAREAFEQVAATDTDCAMAHWGVAMTLFQPLWPTRPGPADLDRGWDAVQRARALDRRTNSGLARRGPAQGGEQWLTHVSWLEWSRRHGACAGPRPSRQRPY